MEKLITIHAPGISLSINNENMLIVANDAIYGIMNRILNDANSDVMKIYEGNNIYNIITEVSYKELDGKKKIYVSKNQTYYSFYDAVNVVTNMICEIYK